MGWRFRNKGFGDEDVRRVLMILVVRWSWKLLPYTLSLACLLTRTNRAME